MFNALLVIAAKKNYKKLANILLIMGAEVDHEIYSGGDTVLMISIKRGHSEMVKLLLKNGANVDQQSYFHSGGIALIYAATNGQSEIVRLLLENRDRLLCYGRMALIFAATNGHSEVVRLLLKNGAKVNLQEGDRSEVVRVLLKNRVNINHEVEEFIYASTSDVTRRTVLIYAAANGHLEVVRLLLENGANINQQEILGKTALIYAAINDHLEVVRLLLENGADVNQQGDNGETALSYAAENGYLELVKLLLKNRANVNHQNDSGLTALIYAATHGHTEIVKLLLENGAKTNHQDNSGSTALIYAATHGHLEIIKLLLKNEYKNFSLNLSLKQDRISIARFIIRYSLLVDLKSNVEDQLSDFPKLIQYCKACRKELEKLVTQKDPITLHSLLAIPKVLNPRNAKRFLRAYDNELIDSSNFSIYESRFRETIEYINKNSYEIKSHEIIKKVILNPKSLSSKTPRVELVSDIMEHVNVFLEQETRNNLLVAALNANNSCPQQGWFQERYQVVRKALGLTRN